MKIIFVTTLFLVLSVSLVYSQSLTAEDIITKSINYHDPGDNWSGFIGKLVITEEREAGDRLTRFSINNQIGRFLFERNDVSHGMLMDSCFVISGEADCDRVATIRNYYLYLWGLPMKLQDAGTNLQSEVQSIEDWHGRSVYVIEVHYERENWSYFIDQNNFALVGYQFMFNYKEGGELITLDGELEADGIKFPKTRTWYELPGETYLAKDMLTAIE
ncbi:DUF6503 family protein [Marinoscillum sp.]|uniref:DUF6503 family protein n=1 Tax=Marinoscillum sp. TaxID=2024838 RepID=UPI003BA967A3